MAAAKRLTQHNAFNFDPEPCKKSCSEALSKFPFMSCLQPHCFICQAGCTARRTVHLHDQPARPEPPHACRLHAPRLLLPDLVVLVPHKQLILQHRHALEDSTAPPRRHSTPSISTMTPLGTWSQSRTPPQNRCVVSAHLVLAS